MYIKKVKAPKTFQNHEDEKNVLKNTIYTKKKKFWEFKYILLYNFIAQRKVYFLLHFGLYSKYSLYEKNIAKHLIWKTRFTELKLPRSVIIGNGSENQDPYQNKTDPKH